MIHCRRNSADVAISNYFQNFKADHPWAWDLGDIGRYAAAVDRVMGHWKTAAALPLLQLDYEDVVADPQTAARRITDFLNLSWDDACARPDRAKGAVLTASNWQVRKPVHGKAVGRAARYAHLAATLGSGGGA